MLNFGGIENLVFQLASTPTPLELAEWNTQFKPLALGRGKGGLEGNFHRAVASITGKAQIVAAPVSLDAHGQSVVRAGYELHVGAPRDLCL